MLKEVKYLYNEYASLPLRLRSELKAQNDNLLFRMTVCGNISIIPLKICLIL